MLHQYVFAIYLYTLELDLFLFIPVRFTLLTEKYNVLSDAIIETRCHDNCKVC